MFSVINDLIKEKELDLGEKSVNLEFFLGGDYKFMLLLFMHVPGVRYTRRKGGTWLMI